MRDSHHVIMLRGVDKQFPTNDGGSLQVLSSIHLTVEEGDLIAIVGPSGCGKSTLLRIMAGFEKPTTGDIEVRQTRCGGRSAFIPQTGALLPWRTLLQNVCVGLEVKETLDEAALEFVRSLIDEYGLQGFENALPSTLSGGMRQRTAVIRALAAKPRLILCDEPFSSIDFVTRLQLSTIFRKDCLVRKRTTILVTHNIEEAIFLGQRIIVMSGRPGRIVNEYRPILSSGAQDAVRCRQAPEFSVLFNQIWNDLKDYHVTP